MLQGRRGLYKSLRTLLPTAVLLFTLWLSAMLFFSTILPNNDTSPTSDKLFSDDYDPLQYIPASTVAAWRQQDFAVVFGIPSEDIEARRRRRNLQRQTCWQYAGVARRDNSYNGSMLVLYVLGRSPSHEYVYTPAMRQEARQWHDAILLDMNEGRKTTKKEIGEDGSWGFEAHVGNSRKVFMWFDLALRTFPRARYIAKGDDDMFLRVPQYLSDMQRLPTRGVYWGLWAGYNEKPFGKKIHFNFVVGMTATLERSVAKAFVSYEPLREFILLPFDKNLTKKYWGFSTYMEDTMTGLALKLSGYASMVCVYEDLCRFYNIHGNDNLRNVTSFSVMVHHLYEEDYEKLMQRFSSLEVYVPKISYSTPKKIYLSCPENV